MNLGDPEQCHGGSWSRMGERGKTGGGIWDLKGEKR